MQIDPFTRASPTWQAAQRTNQANGTSYHMAQGPIITFTDVVSVLLKPYTLIGLGLLGVCIWALCGAPGV